MIYQSIQSIAPLQQKEVWDISLGETDTFQNEPNFIANGVVLHNCHASGVVISDVPLEQIAPLRTAKTTGDEITYATQFAYEDLELLGLIKFDILAISTLTVIARCVKMIKENYGIIIDVENLPLHDKKTLDLYKTGKLTGVFQCESEPMQKVCVEVGVDRFDDIMAVISLFRPGPMDSIPDYCDRKWGRKKITYFHPTIEPYVKDILASTYGILTFQEQVMSICGSLGDMTPTEALVVIKGIGKKKADVIEKGHKSFVEGAVRKGVPHDIADQYWEKFITPFALYGFNKSMLGETQIPTPDGYKQLQDFQSGDFVYAVDESGKIIETEVIALHNHGILESFEVTFDDGSSVICSINHKFLTPNGPQPLWKICKERLSLCGTHIFEGDMNESQNMDCPLWKGIFSTKEVQNTSIDVSGLQEFCLEKENNWRNCYSHSSLWSSMQQMEVTKTAYEVLSGMPAIEERKHNKKDGQAKSGESTSKSQSDFFRYSKENICTYRYSVSENKTIAEVERGEPGKISSHTCKSPDYATQKISHGDMDVRTARVEQSKGPVRDNAKTSRSSKRKDLDRNRWFLSFLRKSAHSNPRQKIQTVSLQSKGERSNAQQGSYQQRSDVSEARDGLFCNINRRNEAGVVGGIPGYAKITDCGNLVSRNIVRVVPVGQRQLYDLEVACSTHNFFLANGVVTLNSHSCCYAYMSFQTAYLKANFPEEFMCSYLNVEMVRRKLDRLSELEREVARMGIFILPRDINKCENEYTIVSKRDESAGITRSEIRPAIHCKGLPTAAGVDIIANRPYSSIVDLARRTDPSCVDSEAINALCDAGFFKTKKDKAISEFLLIREDMKQARKRGRDYGGDIFGNDV